MSASLPTQSASVLPRQARLIEGPGRGIAPPRPKTASPWPWSPQGPVRLAADEGTVWQGGPSFAAMLVRLYHIRIVAGYGVALTFADLVQAKLHGETLWPALAAVIPGTITTLGAMAIFAALAWFSARTTRYTITSHRVVLQCGVALPKTVGLPLSHIEAVAVRVRADGTGDITLKPKPGSPLVYLKLWPFARPWHFRAPEPMLREVPNAGYVASMLSRAVATVAACGRDELLTVASRKKETPQPDRR
ncbi:MAG: photosynthetic complex putative assembly protein PuhB [Acetobacteraceae bacterium]|nr:photosynthetic complex putative assembly protein PuhB [Acetobacteraceae bacterium]